MQINTLVGALTYSAQEVARLTAAAAQAAGTPAEGAALDAYYREAERFHRLRDGIRRQELRLERARAAH